jgi:hypothetical protein
MKEEQARLFFQHMAVDGGRYASAVLWSARHNFMQATELSGFTISHLVKQRDAVGLGPQPDLSGISERRVLDLK